MVLFWGFNKFIHIKSLERCLTCIRNSKNVSYCVFRTRGWELCLPLLNTGKVLLLGPAICRLLLPPEKVNMKLTPMGTGSWDVVSEVILCHFHNTYETMLFRSGGNGTALLPGGWNHWKPLGLCRSLAFRPSPMLREGTSWFLFYPWAKRESLDDSSDGKESAWCRRSGFDPWVRKIP